MDIKKIKQQLIEALEFKSFPEEVKGGQYCGVMPKGTHLICKETGFEIKIIQYRSQLQNRELALTLYSMYLDEVIR